MATAMTADQFLNQLRRWGVPVKIVYDDWRTHNHNDKQPRQAIQFLLIHHTGDDAPDVADERTLHDGRGGSDPLPGPLCNWGMDDDGNVVPLGWGTAYHAGAGASNVLSAVRQENYGSYPPRPGQDDTNGNPISFGQETMYSGTHRMTAAAYQSTLLVAAAICEFMDWTAKRVIGHKEWTSRKPDPGYLDMAIFRADVQRTLDAGPPSAQSPSQTTNEDEPMAGQWVAILSDGRRYLMSGTEKLYISDPAVLDELTNADSGPQLPTRHVSGALANLYRTSDNRDANDAAFRLVVSNTLASLSGGLGALSTAVADDATASQVADLKTQVVQLQELITKLESPEVSAP